MKHVIIPLSALIIYSIIELLIAIQILPGYSSLMNTSNFEFSLLFMFIIIFLESIIYIGFYLPGQLIAVILVTQNSQGIQGVFLLSIVSFFAVTLSSLTNYYIGKTLSRDNCDINYKFQIKKLLLSMIHINTLALFMFEQGLRKQDIKIVFLGGLLNIPYYLLLITLTYVFKEEILSFAENPYGLFILLFLWLIYGIYQEYKERKLTILNKK